MMRPAPLFQGALAVALAAFAAGAHAETIRVTMKDIGFAPAAISAKVGDTIEWINNDFVAHTATAENGDWNVVLAAGAKGSVTLTKAAVVPYFCTYHPNMKGTITVTQ